MKTFQFVFVLAINAVLFLSAAIPMVGAQQPAEEDNALLRVGQLLLTGHGYEIPTEVFWITSGDPLSLSLR